MARVLLAVDGSPSSLNAVKFAVRSLQASAAEGEAHLLNVQPPLPASAAGFVAADVVRGYHEEEGGRALDAAAALLEAAGCRFHRHIVIGNVAASIVDCAKRWDCDQIIMGTRGHGTIEGLILGSVSAKVLHLADIPVTLVK